MGVESSAVQIRINVVDDSSKGIASVAKNVEALGSAASGATGKLKGLGVEGQKFAGFAPPAVRWSQAVREVGESAEQSMHRTHLLTEELDIHVPRAFQHMIAESKMAQAALGAITPILSSIAAIQIGMIFGQAAIESVTKVWEHFHGVTDAVKEYQEQVEKTQEQEFGNSRSIETTIARIDEATEAAKRFKAEADKKDYRTATGPGDFTWREAANILPGAGTAWDKWHKQSEANDLAKQAMAKQTEADKLTNETLPAQQHEKNLAIIKAEYTATAHLSAAEKAHWEYLEKSNVAAENFRRTQEQNAQYHNPVGEKDAQSAKDLADLQNKREYQAQINEIQRGQAQELAHLREEALEARLHGVELYKAQEAAAIEDLKNKDMDSVAARAAVHAKFHAEELKRLREERRATEEIQLQAGLVGFKGIAHTQAEGDIAIGKIRGNPDLSDEAKDARVEAERKRTDAQILEQQQQFSDASNSLADQWAAHQVQGFARIKAEAQKAIDARTKAFNDLYGQLPENDLHRQKGQSDLNSQIGIINGGAGAQTADLASKNAQETAQIEAEARAKLLNSEQDKTAAIKEQYDERVQKYAQMVRDNLIQEQDFNRRVVAAGEEMQAELQEQAKAAREKLAGELRGLMGKHPLQALEEMGSKAAAESGAALLQRFSGKLPGGGNPQGIFAGLAGTHLPGMPEFGGASRTGGILGGGGTRSSMSIAQAQIYVGSGTIIGGGSSGTQLRSTPGFSGAGFSGGGSSSGFGGLSTYTGPAGFGGSGIGTEPGSGAPNGMIGGAGGGLLAQTPGFMGALPGPGSSGPKFGGIGGMLQTGMGAASSIGNLFHGGTLGGGGGSGGGAPAISQLANQDQHMALNLPIGGGSTSSFGSSMLGGGITGQNAMGAAGAGLGVFSAYKQGGVGGMFSGAMSGAQLGMQVGGPWGAAIGAAAGFAAGFFGGGEPARVYDLKTVRPRLANDMQGFNTGSMDYQSAYNDIEGLMTEAKNTTNKMGFAGQRYYQDNIKKELQQAMGSLTREQKAGRTGFSGASYDVGSPYVPYDQVAQVHQGERIFTADHNERMTQAFEQSTRMGAASGFGGDVHLHVHAIDTKGGAQFLMNNKHVIRAAVNESLGENSGGADAGF